MFDGRSAVTMFFVLSGFVLSRPYLVPSPAGQAPRPLCLQTFYLRRVTRIYIPWLFVFGISAMAKSYLFRAYATVPPASEWLQSFWHYPLTITSVLRQGAFLLHDSEQMLIPQDWSLGVELKGSALIPVFLFLVRRHLLALLAVGVMFLVLVPTGAYYVSFILGVLTARYYTAIESRFRSLTGASKLGVFLLGLLCYQGRLAASKFGLAPDRSDKVVWCIGALGCVLILITCLGSHRIERMLSQGPVVFLGRISYSVYLVQLLILLCVLPPLVQLLNAWGIQRNGVLLPLTVCASVLLTTGLAALTYRLIELPSIELGRFLTSRIQRYQVRRSAG
jgi:peptidoglycan/LPS O-acetylase OafA/YrhL